MMTLELGMKIDFFKMTAKNSLGRNIIVALLLLNSDDYFLLA